MKVRERSRTTKQCEVVIAAEQIIGLVRDAIPEGARNVRAEVWVPGGGDWSNTGLQIKTARGFGETELWVRWEIETDNVEEYTIQGGADAKASG